MKPYYADYVNHILRFYTRKQSSGFKNEVDKQNYLAADRVIGKLTPDEQSVIKYIFSQDSVSIVDNVTAYARLTNGDTKAIWSLISCVTNKIAKERKLL